MALHEAQQYDEAVDAFESMLRVMEQFHDPEFRQLDKNYISPSKTIATIDLIVRGVLKNCPLVVIDTTTGCLCDGPERIRIFKAHPTSKELVLSMTRELDHELILRVVSSFFGYVMFSHAWQGSEPSFQDVNVVKSVWKLPDTPLNEKLRNFCKETRRLGHNWAWSDTCCIDKATSSILNQSLTSMYKWYAGSAATLVFLAGVAHPSKPEDLTRSFWMTRAWTLQEFLAPKVIFSMTLTGNHTLALPAGITRNLRRLCKSWRTPSKLTMKPSSHSLLTLSESARNSDLLRPAMRQSKRTSRTLSSVSSSLISGLTTGKEPMLSDISWRRLWRALARSLCLRGQGCHRHTTVVFQPLFLLIAELHTTFPRSKGKK
ncbi:hypothetical protein F5141DRAFT_340615 [Pisolithus sp. B1]|nr:hypothetical protein F5141DRAFT_340615 [Pisolithus sp. B1]